MVQSPTISESSPKDDTKHKVISRIHILKLNTKHHDTAHDYHIYSDRFVLVMILMLSKLFYK